MLTGITMILKLKWIQQAIFVYFFMVVNTNVAIHQNTDVSYKHYLFLLRKSEVL